MSPIIDIQYRLRELGRIRMGKKGPKGAPVKLKSWRLTSASEELLIAAAEIFGGKVELWKDAPSDGDTFELVTTSDTLPIVIPPNEASFSQWMETWSGGGCQKRCDGQRQVLKDVACSCPKDINERMELAQQGKACKPSTRFNVLLPDIPDIGVWRLETHGYYAAVELAAFAQLADLASSQGKMIRARLRIDHRTVKRDGKTQKFTVPVVEVGHRVGDMLQALGGDIDEISMSLPAPVEQRSLPGGAPPLPAEAEEWAIEETVDASDSGLYPWLDALCIEFGEGEVLDAINSLRTRGGAPPLESLKDVADAGPDRVALLHSFLKGEQPSVETEPSSQGGPDASTVESDAATRSDSSVAGGGDGTTTSEEAQADGSTGPSSRNGKSEPTEVLERAKGAAVKKGKKAPQQAELAEGSSSQARGDVPSVQNEEVTA